MQSAWPPRCVVDSPLPRGTIAVVNGSSRPGLRARQSANIWSAVNTGTDHGPLLAAQHRLEHLGAFQASVPRLPSVVRPSSR